MHSSYYLLSIKETKFLNPFYKWENSVKKLAKGHKTRKCEEVGIEHKSFYLKDKRSTQTQMLQRPEKYHKYMEL